jgi:hypothetical protein
MPFDATPTNKEAQILREARAKIDTPEKWGKGMASFIEGGGSQKCVKAAFWNNLKDYTDTSQCVAYEIFRKAAGLRAVDETDPVPQWNDHPKRTHAEVMAAFDKAIEMAEERAYDAIG